MWKEGGIMEKERIKTITILLSLIIFLFYCVIIGYILFQVVNLDEHKNFVCGIIFEGIGILMLLISVIFGILKRVKIGFLLPAIVCTAIYTIILNSLNFFAYAIMTSNVFFLAHMVVLFIYLLIIVPMLVMGKK